jgi:hypothetical protein
MKTLKLLCLTNLMLLSFTFIQMSCSGTEEIEELTEICNNSIDDDLDGFIDCEDFDCSDYVDCI